MLGVEWDSVSLAGAFLVGAVFSSIVVLRLARVIAQFLTEMHRRESSDEHDPRRR